MKKFLSKIIIFTLFIIFCGNLPCSCEEVTFAQLSDIHIWGLFDERGSVNPTYPERLLNDAIDQINSDKKIDFTLITGDIVDAPGDELFLHVTTLFNKLNKPWYYAFGNHDCSHPYKWPKEPLVGILKRVDPYFIENGKYYSFQPKKGFTFMALDGSSYYFDKEQLQFMNDTIRKNPNDVIIIFLHTPIMPPFDLKTHTLYQKDEILKQLKQYTQPIAVFAGHFHATKIIQDGNILHVATPSLRYAQEFRVVNVKNKSDRVIFTFDYKKTNLKDYFYRASRYEGDENDKNVVITIKKSKSK